MEISSPPGLNQQSLVSLGPAYITCPDLQLPAVYLFPKFLNCSLPSVLIRRVRTWPWVMSSLCQAHPSASLPAWEPIGAEAVACALCDHRPESQHPSDQPPTWCCRTPGRAPEGQRGSPQGVWGAEMRRCETP